jgi:Kdo2-lipid IVA lauroyltransferase/acyltransferase
VMRASRLLLAMEFGAYRYALVLVARLPSRVAYGLGRMAGDLQYQVDSSNRKMLLECLELALDGQFSPAGRIGVVHDCFRLQACKDLDRLRLAGNGQGLAKLVKIRGLEHVEHALAQGKGVVIGSAHFGSWEGEIGLLGVLGFPVRLIAYREPRRRLSLVQTLVRPNIIIRTLLYNILEHHLRQPDIVVEEGRRSMVAGEAGRALKRNELIFIMIDVVGSPSRHPNSVPIPFLKGMACVPTGAARIAKSSGVPLLICLIHRSRDWRHQVMEISAPIPTEGDINEINRRCMRVIEDAIRNEPAHWRAWGYKTMAKIGLLPEEEMKRRVRMENSP